VVRLLGFLPEGFPVGPGLIDPHFALHDLRLPGLKKRTKIGFFLVRDPIRGRFGTFVRGKVVIIYAVKAAMKGGRTEWANFMMGKV
jgi:hypothetical protein